MTEFSCIPYRPRRRAFEATLGVLAAALLLGCHTRRPAAVLPVMDERVVLLRHDISLAAVSWLVEIRETAHGSVRGRMQITSGDENRPGIERAYGCRMTRTGDYGSGGSGWACEVPFTGGAPDWRALLTRLDALGVNVPPAIPLKVPGALQPICGDGMHWALEVRPAGSGSPVSYASICGPTDSRRDAFEAGLDSVLSTVERAALVR
jgi:hypothetical protein